MNETDFVIDKITGEWCDFGKDAELMSGLESFAARLTDCKNSTVLAGRIDKLLRDRESAKALNPTIVSIDPAKVKLTDFMKALGQEHPVATDGNLRIYNAPYSDEKDPTMVINIETNLWRDTKSGAYGGIYDLAYEIIGTCNRSELNMYIATEMSKLQKISLKQEPEPVKPPKRKMRL